MVKRLPSAVLRDRLQAPRAAVGTFVKLPGLEVIDCVSLAGLDFAVLDLEHSGLDERTVMTQLAYGRALGLPCLVRLPEPDSGTINRLLEAGACGIQLSDVRRRADVDALVTAAHFPPTGGRGVSTTHRGAGYGRMKVADYVAGAAGAPVLVIQVESELEEPLEELLAAPIDVCFVGVVDLGVRLGLAGQTGHALLAERTGRIAAAARAAGVAFGQHLTAAGTPIAGAQYLTMETDVTTLLNGLCQIVETARGKLQAGGGAG